MTLYELQHIAQDRVNLLESSVAVLGGSDARFEGRLEEARVFLSMINNTVPPTLRRTRLRDVDPTLTQRDPALEILGS